MKNLILLWLSGCSLPATSSNSNHSTTTTTIATTTEANQTLRHLFGSWETKKPHDLCVRFSQDDQLELSFQQTQQPKYRIIGTQNLHTQEDNHYTFHFLPSTISQERYISPCRKKVFVAKDLKETTLLSVSIQVDKTIEILVQYLPAEDRLNLCLEKNNDPHRCFLLDRVALIPKEAPAK